MVELIPKKLGREVPFKNTLLIIAAVLLLAVVFSYVIFLRNEAKALNDLQDLESSIAKVGTKQNRDTEAKVFGWEKKIKNFSILLASRRKASNFFDNFVVLVHPKVWFSSFGLDVTEMKATISGKAPDFRTLEQQLVYLQSKSDTIETVNISDAAISKEGNAEFDVDLSFKPGIFNQAPQKQ